MVGLVLSLLFISFARLKEEDEYTINLRMKSMAWAFKVYGVIVIIATLTIYGLGWYYVMLVFVYLAFLLFIGKFYYELHKFTFVNGEIPVDGIGIGSSRSAL